MHKTKEISAVMVGLAWFILGGLVVSRVIHVGPCDSRLNANCWRLSILRLCRIDLVQHLLRDLIFSVSRLMEFIFPLVYSIVVSVGGCFGDLISLL